MRHAPKNPADRGKQVINSDTLTLFRGNT